jgi:hypothetical protein
VVLFVIGQRNDLRTAKYLWPFLCFLKQTLKLAFGDNTHDMQVYQECRLLPFVSWILPLHNLLPLASAGVLVTKYIIHHPNVLIHIFLGLTHL